jgi:hypothetical protein
MICLMMVSSNVFAVQVIHRPNSYRSQEETNELNRLEEQQELLREQLKIQKKMLQLQQQQYLDNKIRQGYIR